MLGQLASKLSKSDRLSTLDLGKARLQCRESIWIGEDLGGLLQPLATVAHIEQANEVAA